MRLFDFQKVHYVSAPCGSWKTTAACKYIVENIGDCNHMYVAPTLRLLSEVEKTLKVLGITPTIITSDTEPRTLAAIINYLKSAPWYGVVLLITHQSCFRIPYFARRENWQIFIDEIPQLDFYHSPRLPRSAHLLSNYLEVKACINEKISQLGAIDKTALKHFLEKPKDDGEACVREILENALSPYFDVFVYTDDWDRIVENRKIDANSDGNRVRIISLRNPHGFLGTTILGANIEHSMLHHWFRRREVELAPNAEIIQGLRFQEYPADLGERLKIDYYLGLKSFSKARRDRPVTSGRKLIDEMDDAILQEVRGSEFLLVANVDYKGKLLDAPGCQPISAESQGLNSYAHYKKLVFLAALNRSPDHIRMLNALGFDAEVIRQSTVYERLHQCVMRTNLREPESTQEVQVIVPDKFSADFLVGLFPKARVRKIGAGSYQEQQPYTKTERNQRSQFHGVRQQLFGAARETPRNPGQSSFRLKRKCPENRESYITRYWLTFQEKTKAFKFDDFAQLDWTLHQLKSFMKKCASTVIESKTEGYLFSLTKFRPVPFGLRRQVNFVRADGLILDFDAGNLSPEEFVRIFWKDAVRNKRSFIICNSFSRSPSNPNKFRVIMPFRKSATSLEMFQAVYDEIVRRLRSNGYTRKAAKLDPLCRSGIQPFFIPCTNRAHKESGFFEVYGLGKQEFERYGIDPTTYLTTAYEKVTPIRTRSTTSQPNGPTSHERQELALAWMKKIQAMTADRHLPFFEMGRDLAAKGFTKDGVSYWLYRTAGNERKMLEKVDLILSSLDQKGAFDVKEREAA